MATLTLYGLTACDTCRAARKALDTAGHQVTFHDVRKDPLAPDLLARFHAAFGAELVNRRSTTWRTLTEAERSQADDGVVALLQTHPALMKRPVISQSDTLHLGWTPVVRSALL